MNRALPPCPLCQQPLDASLEGFAGAITHHAKPEGEGLLQARDHFIACARCVALVCVTRVHEGEALVSETARVEIQPAASTRALEILDEAARAERMWEAVQGLRPREALLVPAVFAKLARLFEEPIVLREDAYLMSPIVRDSRIRTLRLASDVDADRAKPGYSIVHEADRVEAGTPIELAGLGAGCLRAKPLRSPNSEGLVLVPAWAVAPRT